MKKKIHANSLLFKILCTVITGILCLSILLSLINIAISKRVFVDSFGESQRKIFNQIDQDFYEFYQDMVQIMQTISTDGNVKRFLLDESSNEVDTMQNMYNMKQHMKESKLSDYSSLGAFVIGKDGKSFISSKTDIFSMSKSEIWDSDVAVSALEASGKIVIKYEKAGFTDVMKNSPVLVLAHAWSYDNSEEADAIAFITIKEADIQKMYSYFTSDTSDIILLNQDNEVMSSNNKEYLQKNNAAAKKLNSVLASMMKEDVLKKEIQKDGNIQTYLMQRLQSTNYKIVGVIDPEAAFEEKYNISNLVLLTLLITGVIFVLIVGFVRQQTKPLGRLVRTMQNSKSTDFKEHVVVEGTDEVRELSQTYNDMVDELDKYIHQLIQVEGDKRTAEIHALQMQINPHYMYNTLASVKWLIWQGDAEKSTQVIDAFISLLRNVISNSDEFVTVEQEITNLQNYVLINQARYGDAVKVEFFTAPQCGSYKVPKLILQPFVENAFFHAFPEGRKGCIQVFVKEVGENLRFDIEDNGVGIKTEQLMALNRKENQKSEHFTGIGIGNVDDRIKLIYGMNYGINITSEEGKGTKVTLVVPKTGVE